MEIRRATADDCEALAAPRSAPSTPTSRWAPGTGRLTRLRLDRVASGHARPGSVFTVSHDGVVVGGAIVFLRSATVAYLGRIWLVPEVQGDGLGHQAMTVLESLFPKVTRWQLETPVWHLRNQHFHASCGYRILCTEVDEVHFEKSLPTGSAQIADHGACEPEHSPRSAV